MQTSLLPKKQEMQASERPRKHALEEASAVPQPPETKRRTAGPQGWAHGADGENARHMPLEIAAISSAREQVDPAAVQLPPLLLNSCHAPESCVDQQQQENCQDVRQDSMNQDPLGAGRISNIPYPRGDVQESAKNQNPTEASPMNNKNEAAEEVPAAITNFGADLLTEIFKKIPHHDMPNLAYAYKWFFEVSQTMDFRKTLRSNCSAEERAGLYIGAIIQKASMTYMAVSEDLPRKLKNAAFSLSDFIYNERKNANDLTIWDSRRGRLLITADKYPVNFRICDPFDKPCYTTLPECPYTAQKEEVVTASLVPAARTRCFDVIVIAVQATDRTYITVKKYESQFRQWRERSTQSSFKISERSILRVISVLSGGCMNILDPAKGIIRVDVWTLEISQIPLPTLCENATRRSHMICRKQDRTLCLASVETQTWQVPGTRRSKVVIYALDNVSRKWTLNSEWPIPATLTNRDFVGGNEDLGAVLIGSGWDEVLSMDIETGICSHRMTESGAESDVLCYTIEYPSISWFRFSER